MPTYRYKSGDPASSCDSCSHPGFTEFQAISAAPLASCPDCMAPVFRVIQPVVIGKIDKWDEPVYMSQLVDPNDPDPKNNPKNYVSGPHSHARKVNEAQRAGVRLVTNAEDYGVKAPREIKKEARRG